jgi:alginate O-acetyltransferase complex protein AlgI
MQFDSIDFAIFFLSFFGLYWLVSRYLKLQNIFLLSSSYLFYAWWDYRFLFLLIFSTLLDYLSGLKIHQAKSTNRIIWLLISVVINLGFLGFFKYYNFFIDSFSTLLQSFGLQANIWSLNIILPVGISFYTFHGLSYVFDIYYNKIVPTKSFVDYAVFVSFFPLLVAGPIERATHLLPQVKTKRTFEYHKAIDGLRQILWGLFKKIVIADNCARFANLIFDHHEQYGGATLVLGTVFFALQIYGDFSGYSDIALGTARLLGFDLIRNFSFPYFSRDIAEFWRRWHISLSSWFRDYLYVPLGGSKGSLGKKVRNIFIIFLVSGFWHGANWTFIVWGCLHAIYYLPLLLARVNRNNTDMVAQGKIFPTLKEFSAILLTFSLTSLAWIFFRSTNLNHAFSYLGDLASGLFYVSEYDNALSFIITKVGFTLVSLIGLFVMIEWLGREQQFAIAQLTIKWAIPIRWSFYYSLLIIIILYGGQQQQFIYFQF